MLGMASKGRAGVEDRWGLVKGPGSRQCKWRTVKDLGTCCTNRQYIRAFEHGYELHTSFQPALNTVALAVADRASFLVSQG